MIAWCSQIAAGDWVVWGIPVPLTSLVRNEMMDRCKQLRAINHKLQNPTPFALS
jgi:hypothetical protein